MSPITLEESIVKHPEVKSSLTKSTGKHEKSGKAKSEVMDLSKYKGWKRIHFPNGKKRFVHVNRHAIMRNVKEGKFYPTVIVREDDKEYQFHAALIFGASTLGYNPDPMGMVDANVYVETTAKLLCFQDPTAHYFIDKNMPKPVEVKKVTWFAKISAWLSKMVKTVDIVSKHTPIIGCIRGH